MKKRLLLLMALAGSCFGTPAMANNHVWQAMQGTVPTKGTQVIAPQKLTAYALNDTYLRNYLFSLNDNPGAGQLIELPTPDGGMRTFVIWRSHTMSPGLEAKYPEIRTFTAYALDDHRAVAKLDYTLKGFHAMVMDGANTFFIDPYSNVNDGFYMSYYKHDFRKPLHTRMVCEQNDDELADLNPEMEQMEIGADKPSLPSLDLKVINGKEHRTYRLALACTYEYAVEVCSPSAPTVAATLSAMVTSVNRVTGVYELEMAISLELVANTDDLIWITSNDPYTNNNGSSMLGQNNTACNNVIGSANYDIGHVFSTGGGGIASLGSICGSSKGQGVTGSPNPVGDPFDIDYVAHEMGHQFGGPHTFNSPTGSCSGNRSGNNAYEPGSGTTIMAYAGICGSDNLQSHSDAYFHANSLQRIYNTINQSSKINCPVKVITGNASPGLPSFSASYSIPISTPFELEAPLAIDSLVSDTLLTYCWEEWDRSSSALTWANTSATGPIFRSFIPTESRWRVFPTIQKVVTNVSSYLGEKLPTVARTLTFKLTSRGVYNGLGVTNFSDDSVRLNVINTGAGFAVTAPNTMLTWTGGSSQTVTWNVSQTNVAPISASNVNIYLSVDGGYTYPYIVVSNVPNSGTANITVPNVGTTLARIKVKGAGNVFFDISNVNFTITADPNLPPATPNGVQQVAANDVNIKVFPVPAHDVLNLSAATPMNVAIYNTVGQQVYTGTLHNDMQVNVNSWAKGMYYIHFTTENGKRYSKTVAIQ